MQSNATRRLGVLLILATAWTARPAEAKKKSPFEIRPLSEGVHLFIPTDRGAWDLERTNSMVVEQARGLVVVGAQPSKVAAEELLTAIQDRFDSEVRYLVLTHPTVVSSGGATAFPESVEVIASADFVKALDDPEFDTAAELRKARGADWVAPPLRRPTVAFQGKAILEDPVHPVSVESVTPSYSPGSSVARLPNDEVLFVGPILFKPGTVPFADVADIGAWMSTLNRLISRREVGCVPRVGEPGTRADMQRNRDAFAWLRGNVESAFLKRTPVAEIPAFVLSSKGLEGHFGSDQRDRLDVLIQQALSEAIRERKKRGIPTP